MSTVPTSLAVALDFSASGKECTMRLTPDVAFGSVNVGGYIACVLTKYATAYASQHPKMNKQTAARSSVVQFYRPVFVNKDVTLQLREVSLGKAWSTLRVEVLQGGKVAASVDAIVADFSVPGFNLETHWKISPPPHPVNLSKLEAGQDPNWTSYQTAFYPDGFRRGSAYIKAFIPKTWPSEIPFIEQWVQPGWDSYGLGGSVATSEQDKARWTNDMIQFVIDSTLPIQENLFPREADKPLPMGSIAATLEFAAKQKAARDRGDKDWRPLDQDGSKKMMVQTVHVTLSMSTEFKKSLPAEGVRWLYMRVEAKSIVDGRMDLQILMFDEGMDLIAVAAQVAHIIPAAHKNQRQEKSSHI